MAVSAAVALQHVMVVAANLVYPLLVARHAGLSVAATTDMLRLGMLALAAGLLLQATARGPIGCHYFAPMVYASPLLAPGYLAVEAGGMPLFWGMTMVAGLVSIGLASVWGRLRVLIPPESAGLVVFLVGATAGLAALGLLRQPDGSFMASESCITLLSLAVMIALNVWNKGRLRLFSVLIGILVGYVAAATTGELSGDKLHLITDLPLFSLPRLAHMAWSFEISFVAPFAVTAVATAMVTTAVVTSYQRITNADWVKPDMTSIASGIRADGVANVIAGSLCTFGLAVGPANAGLVAATGVASRITAYPAACMLLMAAVIPIFAGLLTVMPVSVMAAGLLFPAAFIMISGVQIISSRVLDARRTIVIGAGIMTFMLAVIAPKQFATSPAWLYPILGSPIVLATVVALLLNFLFRVGIRRSAVLQMSVFEPSMEQLEDFVTRTAGEWGVRHDAVSRVKFVLLQMMDGVVELAERTHPITLTMAYNEFDIDITLNYRGEILPLPEALPPQEEIIREGGHHSLTGFLIRQRTDQVHSAALDGVCTLRLLFRN